MGIVLMVLSFIWWWPLGLLVLGFMFARGKFGRWRHAGYAGEGQMLDRGCGGNRWDRKMARMQEKMERIRSKMDGGGSGNRAFDDYRTETLKRLEDEQREFKGFLDQLRVAKDRAEFDAFMNDRRRRNEAPEAPPPAPQG